ncbi:MAG: adenylate/guanylate cyclase domain-containing protein [Rhodospirillaceae bacterium]
MPLLLAGALPEAGQQPTGYSQGRERQVVILFADLRESTKIAEHRLPFDVVFILNQFFAELSASLKDTGGHYAQFNGDGLMAIYELDVDLDRAAQMAFAGAENMLYRLANLNDRLKMELKYPLPMGIGIHCGEPYSAKWGRRRRRSSPRSATR